MLRLANLRDLHGIGNKVRIVLQKISTHSWDSIESWLEVRWRWFECRIDFSGQGWEFAPEITCKGKWRRATETTRVLGKSYNITLILTLRNVINGYILGELRSLEKDFGENKHKELVFNKFFHWLWRDAHIKQIWMISMPAASHLNGGAMKYWFSSTLLTIFTGH